ncbi:hypothetical protein [Thermogymnomonas acidicola]|uniref:hypothetical protein n=1 Tax=Thermogymnomonas acidicola TaxID=399579 RepID=UPI00094620A2|nr:hypothetical protein [Thermogymnomonas acidicola]
MSSVSVLFATRDVFAILLALIITGFGASFAMSKILAYISERTTPRLGVFYYETFFGIASSREHSAWAPCSSSLEYSPPWSFRCSLH